MSLQIVAHAALGLSIFLALFAEGTVISLADVRYLFGKPRRLMRTLLAVNVLSPLVAVLVCRTFSLHPAVMVALVTLACAPVGGLFPQAMLALVPAGRAVYAHGVFFATTLLSVLLTPPSVELLNLVFGGDVHIRPLMVAEVAIGAMLLPLGLGIAIGRHWRGLRSWRARLQRLSSLLLLASLIAFVPVAWPQLATIAREGTLAAIAVTTLLSMAAGHALGGPQEDGRTMLAFATVARHPGVALALASLTEQPLARAGVLLAVIVNQFAVLPYKLWRKRVHAAVPAVSAPGAHSTSGSRH